MNILSLPALAFWEIFSNLTIYELKKLSEVDKFFNTLCKNYNTKCFEKFKSLSDNKILSLDMYPEIFCPILKINNFLPQSSAWKKYNIFYPC